MMWILTAFVLGLLWGLEFSYLWRKYKITRDKFNNSDLYKGRDWSSQDDMWEQ